MMIEVFWTMGSMFTAGMAWIILSRASAHSRDTFTLAGWRGLALSCALPVMLSVLAGLIPPLHTQANSAAAPIPSLAIVG